MSPNHVSLVIHRSKPATSVLNFEGAAVLPIPRENTRSIRSLLTCYLALQVYQFVHDIRREIRMDPPPDQSGIYQVKPVWIRVPAGQTDPQAQQDAGSLGRLAPAPATPAQVSGPPRGTMAVGYATQHVPASVAYTASAPVYATNPTPTTMAMPAWQPQTTPSVQTTQVLPPVQTDYHTPILGARPTPHVVYPPGPYYVAADAQPAQPVPQLMEQVPQPTAQFMAQNPPPHAGTIMGAAPPPLPMQTVAQSIPALLPDQMMVTEEGVGDDWIVTCHGCTEGHRSTDEVTNHLRGCQFHIVHLCPFPGCNTYLIKRKEMKQHFQDCHDEVKHYDDRDFKDLLQAASVEVEPVFNSAGDTLIPPYVHVRAALPLDDFQYSFQRARTLKVRDPLTNLLKVAPVDAALQVKAFNHDTWESPPTSHYRPHGETLKQDLTPRGSKGRTRKRTKSHHSSPPSASGGTATSTTTSEGRPRHAPPKSKRPKTHSQASRPIPSLLDVVVSPPEPKLPLRRKLPPNMTFQPQLNEVAEKEVIEDATLYLLDDYKGTYVSPRLQAAYESLVDLPQFDEWEADTYDHKPRGIGSPRIVVNRRQWARKGPGTR